MKTKVLASALAVTLGVGTLLAGAAQAADTIKVGILHSRAGDLCRG